MIFISVQSLQLFQLLLDSWSLIAVSYQLLFLK